MRRKIIRVGSSKGVLLPREVTKAMQWEFGSEIELSVDERQGQVYLKTLKIDIPEDYDIEQLRELEEVADEYKDLIGGLHE
jgi:antitoxin component of MazEF toxin-antitoxin module